MLNVEYSPSGGVKTAQQFWWGQDVRILKNFATNHLQQPGFACA